MRLRACLVLVFMAAASATYGGCAGGCFSEADPVQTNPRTPCLKLHTGQNSDGDSTICGALPLQGTNECADALTLPPYLEGGTPTVVSPGTALPYYRMEGAVPPGITVVRRDDDASDWIIRATLGAAEVVIVIPVHEK